MEKTYHIFHRVYIIAYKQETRKQILFKNFFSNRSLCFCSNVNILSRPHYVSLMFVFALALWSLHLPVYYSRLLRGKALIILRAC